MRELLEETGLRGKVLDLMGYTTFASHRGKVELSNLQLNFLVYAPDWDVKLDQASHSDYRWISLDESENDLLDPFTRNIMLLARQHWKEVGDYSSAETELGFEDVPGISGTSWSPGVGRAGAP
jgi:8-oxo-dGTP pyrophosphatase MutT (NUDIX family)